MAKEAKNKEKKLKDNTSKKEKKSFFKSVKAELKKVIWPTPKQLFNNTLAVIVSVVLVGVIVFVLDVCFKNINTFGIDKLKTVVQSSKNEEVENEVSDSTNVEESNETIDNAEDNSQEGSSEDNIDDVDNAE